MEPWIAILGIGIALIVGGIFAFGRAEKRSGAEQRHREILEQTQKLQRKAGEILARAQTADEKAWLEWQLRRLDERLQRKRSGRLRDPGEP